MADLREAAQSEYTDGSRYGIRPEGYESYGDMDWLGGRDVRPTWTEEDQLRINQIEAEQQMYNQNMGTPYSGGPLQDPSSRESSTPTINKGTSYGQYLYDKGQNTSIGEALQYAEDRRAKGVKDYGQYLYEQEQQKNKEWEDNPYPNGGRFLPYVGNSWWQTSEPILPWNRKDWRKPGDRWYNTGE
jgi:hypothetical protein